MDAFYMLAVSPISAASAIVALSSVAVLYALHHLRAQPTRRPTATLLFWQEAMSTPRTRVPWSRRFTHLRTFLLLASILLLLAATLTANRWDRDSTSARDVIVIDAGEEIGNGTLLHDLIHTATAQLPQLSSPGLIAAGPQPLMLVSPGQPRAITTRALADLTPQSGASASSLAIQAAFAVLGDAPGRIVWFTDKPTLPDGLAQDIRQRIVLRQVASPSAAVISDVTFLPLSDDGVRGVLRVEISGPVARGIKLQAQLPDAQPVIMPVNVDGNVAIENWQADGRSVTLTLLNAPGAPATHSVTYRVPDRRPPVVRFKGNVPISLQQALLAVGTAASDDSNTRRAIFVAPVGTGVPSDAAAVILIDGNGNEVKSGTPLRFCNVAVVKGLSLEGAVASEGPHLVTTGSPVLKADSGTVASLDLSSRPPMLVLSTAIVDSTANLPRHAAFPVLISRLCDALTGRGDTPVMISASRSAVDPLWLGPNTAPAVEKRIAPDPPPAPTPALASQSILTSPWIKYWTNVLLIGAVMLLLVESLLYAARRIV